jgi:hypothetical protein
MLGSNLIANLVPLVVFGWCESDWQSGLLYTGDVYLIFMKNFVYGYSFDFG